MDLKPPVEYQLTVENGSGSGSFSENASVSLSADPPADGMAFDQWIAAAGSLEDRFNSETTFTMPAESTTVTATYKAKEKVKLGTPDITWSQDGTSVSWTSVDGATGYQFYRIKADGEETGREMTGETGYTFLSVGVPGDEFFVRAVDETGSFADGDFASQKYE